MIAWADDGDGSYLHAARTLVLAVGFMLCLGGAGGLVMDDMGHRDATESRLTTSAVIRAATGSERKVAFPAAVSGAILALGIGVTLAVARRP